MKNVQISELELGDVVRLFDGAFGDCVVMQKENGRVTLERPYMVSGDFSYTGGIPVWIGHETITLWERHNRPIEVLYRKGPLK